MKDFFKRALKYTLTGIVLLICISQVVPKIPGAATAVFDISAHAAMNKAEITDAGKKDNSALQTEERSNETDFKDNETSSQQSDSSENAASSELIPDENGVVTKQLNASAANTSFDDIYINNKINYPLDINEILSLSDGAAINDPTKPQILIVHTHTTESYSPLGEARTTDTDKNVVRVGREMCDVLNSMGINTLHDETLHDSPSYTGSYSRAAKTIQSYLEKYPSIGFVIDVHRDSIGGGNSPRVKPTVEINGKPAAQIMFVTGCETGEVTDYPNWKYNLQTALKFQRRIEQDHSGLTRSVYFTDCRYNMNLTKGSVLMEFGSDANTLDEAVYSAHLAAESIAKVLLSS